MKLHLYRHSDEMIRKLESAGLGFYVQASKTRHRLGMFLVYFLLVHCLPVYFIPLYSITLGTIPLRQLVYRVLDLPPSMRPLVFDFGKLSDKTELEYTKQIVKNHVRNASYCVG